MQRFRFLKGQWGVLVAVGLWLLAQTFAPVAGQIITNGLNYQQGHLVGTITTLTAITQSGNPGAPSPPVVAASFTPNDVKGEITWGTGGTPTDGAVVKVTFFATFTATPTIVLQAINQISGGQAGGSCGPYPSSVTTVSFIISCSLTPTANLTPTSSYGVFYHILQ